MTKRMKRKLLLIGIALAVILVVGFIGKDPAVSSSFLDFFPKDVADTAEDISDLIGSIGEAGKAESSAGSSAAPAIVPEDGEFTVEFIDVGQADCILVYEGDNAMLIDGGNNEDGPLVADYLRDKGFETLDYIVCTHAHEDHCGGLDTVIDEIGAENIMLPLTSSSTKSYQTVVQAANNSDAAILTPAVGDTYTLGSAVWEILCCDDTDGDNLNQSSIVIRMDYGETSFMFTGDAEVENEDEMLRSGFDLDCDILKAGHHGSLTSNSVDWLYAVSPDDIIICVGADNSYNLPNAKVLTRYEDTGANIYRTDELGTVIVVTDGHTYSISSQVTQTNG